MQNRSRVLTGAALLGTVVLTPPIVAAAESLRPQNVAESRWGTRIEASSTYSDTHSVWNVVDGSAEHGRGWLSADNAPLPQMVTFTFTEPFPLSRVRVRQASWDGSMYRTREFRLETSSDGKTFQFRFPI